MLVDIDSRTCDESTTLAAAHCDVDPVHAPCPATRLKGRGATVAPRPSLHARPSARFEERVRRAPRGAGGRWLLPARQGGGFTDAGEEMLVLFAHQATSALANVRAHRKEQRAGADLEPLVETCPVVALVLDAASGVSLSLNAGARRILVGWGWSLSCTKHALRVLSQLTSGRDVAIECDGLHPQLRSEVGDGGVTALHRGLRKANLGLG